MNLGALTQFVGDLCYVFLALAALWGSYCAIMTWRRAGQLRFRGEREQAEFLDQLDGLLQAGNFAGAGELCRGDTRATVNLARVALDNAELSFPKVRQLVGDLFQREILAELDYRLSWITTMIKTAPMLGLWGTVLGMMAAFQKLSSGDKVSPTQLADDISLALITTALGLAIAIPLSIAHASMTIQVRKLEDLVALGMTRFLESFRDAQAARRG